MIKVDKSCESTFILNPLPSKKKLRSHLRESTAAHPSMPGRGGWVSCWCGCSQTGHGAAPAHPPPHRPGSLGQSCRSCGAGRFSKTPLGKLEVQIKLKKLNKSNSKLGLKLEIKVVIHEPTCFVSKSRGKEGRKTLPPQILFTNMSNQTVIPPFFSGSLLAHLVFTPSRKPAFPKAPAGLNVVNCRVCRRDLVCAGHLDPNHVTVVRLSPKAGLPHCCWLHKQREGTLGPVQYPGTKKAWQPSHKKPTLWK